MIAGSVVCVWADSRWVLVVSSFVVFLLFRCWIYSQEYGEVHVGILLVHLMRCRWSRVREWDVMTTIIITKVDMFGLRVWHSVVVRLAILIMCRQIVYRLIDYAVVTWNLQWLSLGFSEDDLPLWLSRYTCAVRSNSEVILHHSVDDGPLGVLNRLIMASKVVIGEERFVRRVFHLISEKRRNEEDWWHLGRVAERHIIPLIAKERYCFWLQSQDRISDSGSSPALRCRNQLFTSSHFFHRRWPFLSLAEWWSEIWHLSPQVIIAPVRVEMACARLRTSKVDWGAVGTSTSLILGSMSSKLADKGGGHLDSSESCSINSCRKSDNCSHKDSTFHFFLKILMLWNLLFII